MDLLCLVSRSETFLCDSSVRAETHFGFLVFDTKHTTAFPICLMAALQQPTVRMRPTAMLKKRAHRKDSAADRRKSRDKALICNLFYTIIVHSPCYLMLMCPYVTSCVDLFVRPHVANCSAYALCGSDILSQAVCRSLVDTSMLDPLRFAAFN